MKNIFPFILLFLWLGPIVLQAQQPGRSAFVQAENYRKQNQCTEAIDQYNEAIRLEPNNYRYYFRRGLCQLKLNRADDAKESFRRTTEYNVEYSPAYSMLAKLYKEEGDLDESVYYYDQAARYERNPERQVQYKMRIVNMLLQENRTYDAERHLQDARGMDPDNAGILFYTAKMAADRGDWDRARVDYERALDSEEMRSASPAEQAKYYYGLGQAYSKLGDNEAARRAWAKANFGPYKRLIQQEMMRSSHIYYYRIALSYYFNGEYREAEEYIDRSLDLQRDFSNAYILLAKIARKRGDIGRAIDFYQRAIEMEQDPAKVAKMYALMASLQLSNNDSYGALGSVDRALQASPGNSSLLFLKARAEYESDRFRDAISTLDQLLVGADAKSRARYNFIKGMAARRAGESQTAEEAFKNALFGPFKPAAQVELERLSENGGGR